MFVDEYKGFRDSIYSNDNKDGCPFDYIGTCPYFEEMKDSKIEINSCDQCKILIRRRYYSKCLTDCRNNDLDPDSDVGKGYITEVLVAKFLGIKTCFDMTGVFNHKAFDMYEHEDWGKIDVKGSNLYDYNGYLTWHFNTKKNKYPDFFFCIGYDKEMMHVESVYIIPNGDDVCELVSVSIPKGRHSKWNVFKESEEELKKWDELFHVLKLENCPVLRNRE